MKIIGRYREAATLDKILTSKRPEFLALYGRRRVGKTFLIRNFFGKKKNVIFFTNTGLKDGSLADQIANFSKQIGEAFYHGAPLKAANSWNEVFELLTHAISMQSNKKIVLFFDEFPWMVTPKSKLLQVLDYYWNQYWSMNPNIKLIICGSSASWIINNIINNKGGLHNRITNKIQLEPFNLKETKIFLEANGVKLNKTHLLKLYMAIGGIPYYLMHVEPGASAIEIISRLFFDKKSILHQEFNNLFTSLFDEAEIYQLITQELAKAPYGKGKTELLKLLGKAESGGGGIKKLQDLEASGFVMHFKPFKHRRQGIYYRLIDEYCLFYLKWIAKLSNSLQEIALTNTNWSSVQDEVGWSNWLGYGFEIVCYKHLNEIRKKLNIPPTARANSWRYVPRSGSTKQGAQIDLLFDRDDDAITICEIKYSEKPYVLDKQDIQSLMNKKDVFQKQTGTTKQISVALISPSGVKNYYYADTIIDKFVTLDDLID
jgi:AAA+ ATPase superfamily predicted ATPase